MRAFPAVVVAFAFLACSSGQTQGQKTSNEPRANNQTLNDAQVSATSEVPAIHRATDATCPSDWAATIPDAPQADAGPDLDYIKCLTDADCTAGVNGRCYGNGHDGWSCYYDTCSTDADCKTGELCSCRTPWHYGSAGPNTCLPSDCRVDADCGANGYCSPSLDAACGTFAGVTSWHCHRPGDACTTDDDCKGLDGGYDGPAFCGYQPEVGKWACLVSSCAG